MTGLNRDENNYGIQEISAGQNPTIDIVAVHGLNGHPFKSWSSEKAGLCWLAEPDLLPRAMKNARILTWGYNANVTSLLGNTSSDRILNHAQTLVAQLEADRSLEDATKRPIIFLCHSLGGIIVKKALAYSASRTSAHIEHLYSIYVSTYAVLFLGTPHNGSDKAKLAGIGQRMLSALVPKKVWDTDSQLLDALQEGSETLQAITDQFSPLMKQFRIFFFWEQERTDLGYTKDYVVNSPPHSPSARKDMPDGTAEVVKANFFVQIVDESSAAPILDNVERSGIPADHLHMCKFESKYSPGYKVVVAALIRYAREAPARITVRWRDAEGMLRAQRSSEAAELVKI